MPKITKNNQKWPKMAKKGQFLLTKFANRSFINLMAEFNPAVPLFFQNGWGHFWTSVTQFQSCWPDAQIQLCNMYSKLIMWIWSSGLCVLLSLGLSPGYRCRQSIQLKLKLYIKAGVLKLHNSIFLIYFEFLELYFRNYFWKFIVRFLAKFLANLMIFILRIFFRIKTIF